MFKYVKDVRRRSVETLLESVGATEKTVDPEYDVFTKNFEDMMQDMNECGACITSVLVKQKTFFEDAVELANSLVRIYEKNATDDYWPSHVPQKLTMMDTAIRYRNALNDIHTNYRSSMAKCCSEISLQPFRSAVTAMGPDIERETAICGDMCKDYDSYQRRLRVFKSKLEASTGKPNEDEARAEVEKFETKVKNAKANYEEQNAKVKTDITSAKRAFDAMVEMELVAMLVSQQALFEHASDELKGILSQLPDEKVTQVTKRLNEYIKQGGVKVQEAEKSRAEMVLDVALGKAKKGTLKEKTQEQIQEREAARLEELERAKTIVSENLPVATPVDSSSSSSTDARVSVSNPPSTSSNRASNGDSNQSNPFASPSAPPPPPPPPPPQQKKKFVEAMFDHEAEESDELNFKVGERIEVLDDSDEGWWEGKSCSTGLRGIFPVNYVKRVS